MGVGVRLALGALTLVALLHLALALPRPFSHEDAGDSRDAQHSLSDQDNHFSTAGGAFWLAKATDGLFTQIQSVLARSWPSVDHHDGLSHSR